MSLTTLWKKNDRSSLVPTSRPKLDRRSLDDLFSDWMGTPRINLAHRHVNPCGHAMMLVT